MKKRQTFFILASIGPAVICFLVMFAYPLIRTLLMSLNRLPAISSSTSEWQFAGLDNYIGLFQNSVFVASLKNIGVIWLVGGILTLGIALFFAVILASGVKGKKFWRSAIYLPNTISAVALSTMWLQYIFQNKFGLLTQLFTALGWTALAKLILLSGIEGIPQDIYESAKIDGANSWIKFWKITFPLLRNVIRTCITLWTVGAVNFFVWAKMFSTRINTKTITPVYFLYENVFGAADSGSVLDIGAGAAVGVVVALLVLACYLIMNRVFKEEALEY